jgi:hypothetical protein
MFAHSWKTHFWSVLSLGIAGVALGVAALGQVVAAAEVPQAPRDASAAASNAPLAESYLRLPLSFEANLGQAAQRVQFLARGQGYGLYLGSGEA